MTTCIYSNKALPTELFVLNYAYKKEITIV